jgi:hypothetical protein
MRARSLARDVVTCGYMRSRAETLISVGRRRF